MTTTTGTKLTNDMVREFRGKLLMMKAELLNRVRQNQAEFGSREKFGGDEIDQTVANLDEHSFVLNQKRLRDQILEIEFALGRIENGSFGVCEETEEPIEVERLLAIPWTRLSIEGAEIREASARKFAR